jgi:hypothetical protein
MEQTTLVNSIQAVENPNLSKPEVICVNKISNAVLQRLMEEVKYENQNNILAYNRTHNRHNRGR